MKKIILFLIFIASCSPDQLDQWEGQKIFIDAQLKIDQPVSIFISNTINPVGIDSTKSIKNAKVNLIVDEVEKIDLFYNENTDLYESEYVVTSGKNYRLTVENDNEIIQSRVLDVPKFTFHKEVENIIFTQDTFSVDLKITIPEIHAYKINFKKNYSRFELAQFSRNRSFNTNNACYNETSALNCLLNKDVILSWKNTFSSNHVTLKKGDYIDLVIQFDSKELTDQKRYNEYNGNEGRLQSFSSGFKNGYGVFGYKYISSIRIYYE